jgi:D-alanyl-D-alanine carboxypeptidase (penicillin-binding protein 5/6)
MMTALLTLEDHPLEPGAGGPALTITPGDVAQYKRDFAEEQSTVAVRAGEVLDELELLQGLLIPSANNFADILAVWVSGSVPAFVQSMNARAAQLQMSHTHFADASGFDPQTTSVPQDLLVLARKAMAFPVFAAIVSQPSAVLPVAGLVRNYDTLLGSHGIFGIKTGNSPAAGGAFVFAGSLSGEKQGGPFTIYGAVLGQPDLSSALALAPRLISALAAGLQTGIVQHRLETIGLVRTAWGTGTAIRPADFSVMDFYDGMIMRRTFRLRSGLMPPLAPGSVVGTLELALGEQVTSIPLITQGGLPAPSIWWRLTRHF